MGERMSIQEDFKISGASQESLKLNQECYRMSTVIHELDRIRVGSIKVNTIPNGKEFYTRDVLFRTKDIAGFRFTLFAFHPDDLIVEFGD